MVLAGHFLSLETLKDNGQLTARNSSPSQSKVDIVMSLLSIIFHYNITTLIDL